MSSVVTGNNFLKENTVLKLNISPEISGQEERLILEIGPKCAFSLLRFYQPQIPAIHRMHPENKTNLNYNKTVTPFRQAKVGSLFLHLLQDICSNF